MLITSDELRGLGFRRAGTVYPDDATVLRVEVTWKVEGFVVYVMVVNGEFKKAGTTGRQASTFKSRMHSTFSALRQTIRKGPPYQGDPFKQNAPAAILARQEVELWAMECPSFEWMFAKETELNNYYRPEWTKEGRAS